MDFEKVNKLTEMIKESNNIVFFGGAGVSTESGIPDFRSKDGLYNQKYKKDPEYMLSKECFEKEPEEFWRFYRDKILIDDVNPNPGHFALAKLEEIGKLKAIITQNIDDLHEQAGSKKVFHIHGSILTNHCPYCKREYSLEEIKKMPDVPICYCGISKDKGKGMVIKPDVTLYGENLPQEAWDRALMATVKADMMIVAGTSLVVHPANTIVSYFKGKYLVIINRDKTDLDQFTDLVIRDNFGEVMKEAIKNL